MTIYISVITDNLEVCAMELFLKNDKLSIVSCYRPPNLRIDEDQWCKFLLQVRGVKSLIAGDVNAHHYMWGGKRICQTGRIISECMLEAELDSLNDGRATFRSHSNQAETAL